MKTLVITLTIMVLASFVSCLHIVNVCNDLGRRLDMLETIRAGIPFGELKARGFSPYKKSVATFGGKPATMYTYRSSGSYGAKTADFVVIVGNEGIVLAAWRIDMGSPPQFPLPVNMP